MAAAASAVLLWVEVAAVVEAAAAAVVEAVAAAAVEVADELAAELDVEGKSPAGPGHPAPGLMMS